MKFALGFHTCKGLIKSLLLCSGINLLLMSMAWAQSTASISGRAVDATGAAFPAASVTVKNLETGATRGVNTDNAGFYRVLSLPVGHYEVKAEKEGFKTEVRSGITLTVGQEAVVNLSLEVGQILQEVTVTAEAPLVNTTTAQTAGLVGEREVKELPLNGRSFDNLITLNAGTVNFTSMQNKTSVTAGFGNWFSVSGRRPDENFFLLNGVEYTSASQATVTPGGVSGQLLGIDAIREFNVVKDSYSAAYGKRSGAQVSMVTMSGTNQFHGSVFEFLRNSALDARNFFDPGEVPPFKRNNFGFSAGGPIRKDKTFVFGNYEGFRQRLGLSNVAVVPDSNARRGLLPDRNNPGQLINVGLAPGIAPYFALWPEPNGPNLGDGTALLFSSPSSSINEDFFTTRLDHNFSESDTLNGVYTFDGGESVNPGVNPLSGSRFNVRNQVLSLQETHVFSPNVVNTFTAGFSRGYFNQDTSPLAEFPASLSSIEGRLVAAIGIAGSGVGGAATTQAIAAAGTTGNTHLALIARNLFTYGNQLQINRGIHLITTGVWFERIQVNQTKAGSGNGIATFNSLPDFLQGNAARFQAGLQFTPLGWRQLEGAWYIQDAIKVKPNLTLELGLRHEFTDGWNEVAGRASNWIVDPGGVVRTELLIGNSLYTENNSVKLFGPRVGLAGDPFGNGKTSIRAGFGIHYTLQDNLTFCCTDNPPFNVINDVRNAKFPIHVVPGTPLPGAQVRIKGIQTDAETPTVRTYTFKIEQEIDRNLAVSAAYSGSRGVHGMINPNLNTAVPTICSDQLRNCPAGLPDGTKYFPAGSPLRNPVLSPGQVMHSEGDSRYNALLLELTRRFSRGLQLRANYTFAKSMDNGSQLTSANAIGSSSALLDPEDPRKDRGLSSHDLRNRFSFSSSYELPLGKGKSILGGVLGAADKLVSGWQLNTIVSIQSGLAFSPQIGFIQSRNGTPSGSERPNMAAGRTLSGIYLRTPERWYDPTAFALPLAGTYGNVGRNVLTQAGLASVDLSFSKNTNITESLRLQFRAEAFNLFNRTNFGVPNVLTVNRDGSVPGAAGRITYTSTSSRQLQFGLKLVF